MVTYTLSYRDVKSAVEIPDERHKNSAMINSALQEAAQRLLRRAEEENSRTNPTRQVIVQVERMGVRNEVFTAVSKSELKVAPPVVAFTQQEFEEEEQRHLSELPKEFHEFVRSYSWEKGHAYGREEVIGYVMDLCAGLKEAIQKYDARRNAEKILKPSKRSKVKSET